MSAWMDKLRKYFYNIFLRLSLNRQSGSQKTPTDQRESWENPFLFYVRQVIEKILAQRQMGYRLFKPIVIDTDMPHQRFGEEDDVDQVLSLLEKGLNFLEICTDRPEHFAEWKSWMENEYGLIVRLIPKSSEESLYGNVVLDFERNTPLELSKFSPEMIYVPVQKRRWELAKQAEDHLDINVPIGYNMWAVRVEKNEYHHFIE